MPKSDNPQPKTPADTLALLTIGLVFCMLLTLSLAVLQISRGDPEISKYVFASVLPLLGSWMGAIIAHYFQKENMAAANQSITDLAAKVQGGSTDNSPLASTVMIKWDDIKTIPAGLSDMPNNYATVDLKALADALSKSNQQRLPLFQANRSAFTVIHLSVINDYLTQHAAPPAPSLGSFLADPLIIAKLAGSFDVYSTSASLVDVQKAMTQQCEDVFLTQNGKPGEPVLGWVTNDLVISGLNGKAT